MVELPSRTSLRLQLHGHLDRPVDMLDLAHVLASFDLGQIHGGYTGEKDLLNAFVDAHEAGKSVELYSPACGSERILDSLVKPCVDFGLTCTLWAYGTVPAGYRYEGPESEQVVVVASPEAPLPRMVVASGQGVRVGVSEVRAAIAEGRVDEFLAEREALVADFSSEAVTLSPEIRRWLGVEDRRQVAPSPGF